jgi:hypothetical protein
VAQEEPDQISVVFTWEPLYPPKESAAEFVPAPASSSLDTFKFVVVAQEPPRIGVVPLVPEEPLEPSAPFEPDVPEEPEVAVGDDPEEPLVPEVPAGISRSIHFSVTLL